MRDKPGQRKILIVEPNPTGHRLYYVRLIAQVALDLGCRVSILTRGSAPEAPEWNLHLETVTEMVNFIFGAAFRSHDISEVADRGDFDHVVVPDGDSIAIDLGLRGKWASTATLSILIMRSPEHSSIVPRFSSLKGWIKSVIIYRASRIARVKVCFLRSSLWAGAPSSKIVRDPVTLIRPSSKQLDETTLGLDEGKYWFGIVGAITDRKNVPLVVKALAALNRPDVGLLIAGRLADSVRQDLRVFQENCSQTLALRVVDRLLSDEEIDQFICGLDCVVLAHSNEGSSGIFGKAAAAGTRVVAAGALSLKRDCRIAPDIGLWSPLELTQLSNALDEASRLDRPEARIGLSSREFALALL